ncbi:GntR family transcriptional regulator [bacterium]|nr:GntR family transcriptional regulator [bacterium]
MNFTNEKAIFLQIADHFFDSILAGKWPEGERIPSVREMALAMEVNPNTIMRTYSYLQDNDVVFNRRGLGYFVSPSAKERVKAIKRNNLIENELPKLFEAMRLLEIDFEELRELFSIHHSKL